jgi:hypothetical protein
MNVKYLVKLKINIDYSYNNFFLNKILLISSLYYNISNTIF